MDLFGWIFIGLYGLGGAIATVVFYRRTRRRLADSYRTWGEIVEIRERPGRQTTLKHPMIRFRAKNGEEIVFESSFGKSPWDIKVGDQIELWVRNSNPREAEVVRFFAQWGPTAIAGTMAFGGLIVGPIVMLFGKRWIGF